jgi:RNA polymerase sigma factor (TIGR02999 family)
MMDAITQVLRAIEQGDPHAASQLLPLVYDELRKLAAEKMANERPGQTLEATALVHEAYVRLVGNGAEPHFNGRGHFFAAAAQAMRNILVDNARRKRRPKHGGGRHRVTLDEALPAPPDGADELLALDEALSRLAAEDPEASRIVQLRYFAGLSVEEAAQTLGLSRAHAYRQWTFARAWLLQALSGGEPA